MLELARGGGGEAGGRLRRASNAQGQGSQRIPVRQYSKASGLGSIRRPGPLPGSLRPMIDDQNPAVSGDARRRMEHAAVTARMEWCSEFGRANAFGTASTWGLGAPGYALQVGPRRSPGPPTILTGTRPRIPRSGNHHHWAARAAAPGGGDPGASMMPPPRAAAQLRAPDQAPPRLSTRPLWPQWSCPQAGRALSPQ